MTADEPTLVATSVGAVLRRQHANAWALLSLHLRDLEATELLWRPARAGPHVHELADGTWTADWPDVETYEAGAPSIAWLTWHVGFWLSMVLDHSFGNATLTREQVQWPGPNAATAWINELHERWTNATDDLSDGELGRVDHVRWPMTNRSFADLMGWLNVELMKNAAEIGYARFLYGAAHAGDM